MTMFNVKVQWDPEAHVWWAESNDVPGLVAEAATHDELLEEVRHLVPELLALNSPQLDLTNAMVRFSSDRVESVCYA
jgi:hypothetical protein